VAAGRVGPFQLMESGPPPAARGICGCAGVVVVRKPAWPKRSAGLAGFPFREERPRDQLRRLYRASGEGGAADREGPFPCCVGASERSACPPLMRRAKGDAASIRCSIPLSCKAAVVCAGLTAAGGKGGARPRRGGAGLLRPGGPTNRPAFGGRAPRPKDAAVGRSAAAEPPPLAGNPIPA